MPDVKIHPMQFNFLDMSHTNYGCLVRSGSKRSIYFGLPELPQTTVALIQLAYQKGDDNTKTMILDAYKAQQPIAVGIVNGKGNEEVIPFRDYALAIDAPESYNSDGKTHTCKVIEVATLTSDSSNANSTPDRVHQSKGD